MPTRAAETALELAATSDQDLEATLAHVVAATAESGGEPGLERLYVLRSFDSTSSSLVSEWSRDRRCSLAARIGTGRRLDNATMPFWQELQRQATAPYYGLTDDLPPHARLERASMVADGLVAYVRAPVRTAHHDLGSVNWEFSRVPDDPQRLVDEAADLAAAVGVALLRQCSLDDAGASLQLELMRARDDELVRVIRLALRDLAASTNADRALLLEGRDDVRTIDVVCGWEDRSRPLPASVFDAMKGIPYRQFPWAVEEIRAGRIVRLDDIACGPDGAGRDCETWEIDGSRANLIVPIDVDTESVGAVVLSRVQPGDWSDRHVQQARRVAAVLRPAMERYRRVERERSETERERQVLATTMELLGNMSHDLKTPLHAIAGYADLVDRSSLSSSDRSALDSITHHADRLGALVDDLVAAARPSSGGSSALRPLVLQALRQYDSIAEARHIEIVTFGIAQDATVPLDGAKTRQVMRCLLSGAMLAVGKDSVVQLASTEFEDHVEITMELQSTQPVPHAALSFPIARAVLGDRATIEIERLPDTTLDGARVTVRFGER